MSTDDNDMVPVADLVFSLEEGWSEEPPPGLRARVLHLAGRTDQHRVAPDRLSPNAAFSATLASLERLLAGLDAEGWAAPAIRNLTVQGLVGHLIGVERDFHATIGLVPPRPGAGDHVGGTAADSAAEAEHSGAETLTEWQVATALTTRHLDAILPGRSSEAADLHGIVLPLADLLIARVFELWTHEEDIRRAVGLPCPDLDEGRMRLMVTLAVELLAGIVAHASRSADRVLNLTLTGSAGGSWSIPGADPGAPVTALTLDTMSFCRLIGNRVRPDEVAAVVIGDDAFAQRVLVGATALALD